jgi:hypothetical protein
MKVNEKLLVGYLKRNVRLAFILSVGALILVLVVSSSGAFCYLVSKKSMSVAAEESPVDAVIQQNTYVADTSGRLVQLPSPYEFLQAIYAEPDVANAYGLAAVVLNLNVSINSNDTGMHNVMILSVSRKEAFNVTLLQGSQIQQYNDIIVSEGFCEEFNVTLGNQVKLARVISGTPPFVKTLEFSGNAVGVTPKHFSQLTEELGLHDSLLLAGHTEAQLLYFDQYPFVLVNMSHYATPLFLEYATKRALLPSILASYFVKFNPDIYLNAWDSDVTVYNLKEQAQSLLKDMNNLTATRGYENEVVSIAAIPAANVFQELSQFINISRLTVIAFGATVAFVGWYFYSSVSQVSLSARTRELQLMRIRGVPQKSVRRSISLVVVVSGLVGTAAGMLIGFVLTTSIGPSILNLSMTETDVAQTFGIPSLMFYALFGLAAAMISQRQVLSKLKTVTPRAEEASAEVKSRMGLSEKSVLIVAVVLGIIKVADWLFGFSLTGGSGTANPITSAAVLFFKLIDETILDALGALLLIYAVVTFLSRRPEILSSVSHWISRVLSPRLSLLSRKIMSVKSAKMAGIMIVASLLVFNTVSANMGYWGVKNAWGDLSRTVVGADARIDMPEDASSPVIQLLNSTSDILSSTQILTADCGTSPPLGTSVTYIIDPKRYSAVMKVRTEGLEFIKPGEIIVSEFYREMGLLNIGDKVTLRGGNELTVRRFIKSIPGLLSVPPVQRFALMSVESIEASNYIVIARTLLVRLNGSQPDTFVQNLTDRLPESVRLKLSTATESQITAKLGGRIAAPLIVESVISILLIASAIGLVFAALALGVMGYGEAVNRRGLDDLLRVKGVNRRQLIGLALSEALCILALSLIIGFFAGYAMAHGYTSYFSAAFPVGAAPALSYDLLTQMLALIAIYFVAFLAPVLYAQRKTRPIRI